MKINSPTLAVIIPCWNEEQFLPQMLECLLKQTFNDWIAICVDDQSVDNTAKIIKSYQAKDNRIQYFCRNREPKGGQTCRNIGLQNADGAKYVCFFDADDLIAPYCLEQRVEYMEMNLSIEAAAFPLLAFSNNIDEEYGPVFGVKTFENDLKAMLNLNIPMAVSTNIYRYNAIRDKKIEFDEKVQSMQDSDFSFQIILSDIRYAYASEAKADYFYRVTNDGVASTINAQNKWRSHLYLAQKVSDKITCKYGDAYDTFIAIYMSLLLKRIGLNREAYQQVIRMPWVQAHSLFRLMTIFYMLFGINKLWCVFFYKYRWISKRKNNQWRQVMSKWRKVLLARGVEL